MGVNTPQILGQPGFRAAESANFQLGRNKLTIHTSLRSQIGSMFDSLGERTYKGPIDLHHARSCPKFILRMDQRQQMIPMLDHSQIGLAKPKTQSQESDWEEVFSQFEGTNTSVEEQISLNICNSEPVETVIRSVGDTRYW